MSYKRVIKRGGITVFRGKMEDVMSVARADGIDAIVTDPPYELGFMGKHWDGTGIAFDPETWRQCYRVLKPGGHMLVFGGTRTFHRIACAIEDAGFEMRDSIAWLYGSGFPKSMDVSKAIDKAAGATREVTGPRTYVDGTAGHWTPAETYAQDNWSTTARGKTDTAPATDAARQWDGWGTALKPAFEPIIVARKPLSEKTVASNVLEHGTGALNIDACRVDLNGDYKSKPNGRPSLTDLGDNYDPAQANKPDTVGRWPTNVLLDGVMADQLDREGPHTKDGVATNHNRIVGEHSKNVIYGARNNDTTENKTYGGKGGPSRFFPVFRYRAKAPAKERPKVDGVAHPTVKPLELMRWLVKLVTPPGGVVLDPFAGSGTTVEAAMLEGLRCIAIERERDYIKLIRARIERNT